MKLYPGKMTFDRLFTPGGTLYTIRAPAVESIRFSLSTAGSYEREQKTEGAAGDPIAPPSLPCLGVRHPGTSPAAGNLSLAGMVLQYAKV